MQFWTNNCRSSGPRNTLSSVLHLQISSPLGSSNFVLVFECFFFQTQSKCCQMEHVLRYQIAKHFFSCKNQFHQCVRMRGSDPPNKDQIIYPVYVRLDIFQMEIPNRVVNSVGRTLIQVSSKTCATPLPLSSCKDMTPYDSV